MRIVKGDGRQRQQRVADPSLHRCFDGLSFGDERAWVFRLPGVGVDKTQPRQVADDFFKVFNRRRIDPAGMLVSRVCAAFPETRDVITRRWLGRPGNKDDGFIVAEPLAQERMIEGGYIRLRCFRRHLRSA